MHVGPLSVSQPLIVIVDPIVSIALSVWVYGETFTADMPRAVRRGAQLRGHVRGGDCAGPDCAGDDGQWGDGGGFSLGPAQARPNYRASSGKKTTQLVCMDAPSATIVAPQT